MFLVHESVTCALRLSSMKVKNTDAITRYHGHGKEVVKQHHFINGGKGHL